MRNGTLHLPKRQIETDTPYQKDEWQLDAYGCYVIAHHATGKRLAFIVRCPPYCDRGHWQAAVENIPDIDSQDGFPRYYMNLERALDEMTSWLNWRIFENHSSGE